MMATNGAVCRDPSHDIRAHLQRSMRLKIGVLDLGKSDFAALMVVGVDTVGFETIR